jgi:hypothetical protein
MTVNVRSAKRITVVGLSIFSIAFLGPQEIDESDLTSIQKYWTNLVRTIEQPSGNRWVPLDNRLVRRFLGYIEGKTDSAIPHSWEKCFLAAEVIRDIESDPSFNRFYAPDKSAGAIRDIKTDQRTKENVLLRFDTTEFSPRGYFDNTDEDTEYDGFHFRVANGRIKIWTRPTCPKFGEPGSFEFPEAASESLIDQKNKLIHVNSVIIDGNFVFVASPSLCDDECLPGATIRCFNRSDNKLVWKSRIENYVGFEFRGTTSWFSVLALSRNSLLVFSACDTGLSIERLNKEDGKGETLFVWPEEKKRTRK